MEIVVTDIGKGRFAVRAGGEFVCTSRTPLQSAARELRRRGVSDATELTMRRRGTVAASVRTTVGVAAGVTVGVREGGDERQD